MFKVGLKVIKRMDDVYTSVMDKTINKSTKILFIFIMITLAAKTTTNG